jgi:quercetin dioxygenase-like cupin family protein
MLPAAVVMTVMIGSLFRFTAALQATPASGFVGTTIAVGRFSEISVFNKLVPPDFWKSKHRRDIWLSWQKTVGASDVYVQSNVWQPGGTTGWHTHPGHSLIIVTEGTVTAYEGDDPACQPTIYTAGMGLVDPGGDHVHNLRNEGAVEAKTIAVQLIPADATRRVDMPSPGNCPF